MWCHLAAFLALLGIPFGQIVGPMVTWQMKKDESVFVDEHGKESINFQMSFLIYTIAAFIAILVFFIIGIGSGVIAAGTGGSPGVLGALILLFTGGLIGPVLGLMIFPIVGIVLAIIAAIKAANGEYYRYPLTIRFLR